MGTATMWHTLLARVLILWVALPYLVQADLFPAGVTHTECLDRVFYIWVNQTFFGSSPWQLEALGDHGIVDVMGTRRSAQCGYTVTKDVYRNPEIRISFLGCWVNNTDDKTFTLKMQFRVNRDGKTALYPLAMSCSPSQPWDVREIICEENYMEVSVSRIIPADILKNIRLSGNLVSISQGWQVWFLNSSSAPVSAQEAINRGYGVNATITRVVFRAPYNTSESQIASVGKFHLDLISSNMLYRQTLLRLIVETTIACPNDPPVFTESAVSWLTPVVISPLVSGDFRDSHFAMGVNGRLLNASDIAANWYIFRNDSTTVEITVPFGSPGGYVESDIVNYTYVTAYSIHLLLQRQWLGINEDDSTTHTAYRAVSMPLVKQLPVFLDHTKKEKRYFNVSLGNFYADVNLKSFVIHEVPLTLAELGPRGMTTSSARNPNNTNAFYLTVPFTDPVVEQKYVSGYLRRYTLYVTYILTLVSKNKDFSYTDQVECVLEDAVPPTYRHECGTESLILYMTHGNMDRYWIPYIRNLPLTNALITSQNLTVTGSDKTLILEVPRTSIGVVYEVATLEYFQVRLNFMLRDNKTLEVKSNYSFVCVFPPISPVCLSNGSMIAIVDGTSTKPPFDARKSHLKDPSCTPQNATKDRALFNFPAYTCGTTRQFNSDYLVYENEVTFNRLVLLPGQPIITRDSTYRLTIRCRYPIRDTQWLGIVYKNIPSHYGFEEPVKRVFRQRSEAGLAELKVAKDEAFNTFYQLGDYPVSVHPSGHLNFQAVVEGATYVSKLQDCWATAYHSKDRISRWDLITDGLATGEETFPTEIQTSPGSPPRFQVTFAGQEHSQLYIHCKIFLCNSALYTCHHVEQVTDNMAAAAHLLTEMVSAGPIQIVEQNDAVVSQQLEMESWSTWSWVLALGLAIIAALTVGAIYLMFRLFVK